MKTFLLILFTSNLTVAQNNSRYTVLITEIMADPQPVVSLPAYEYVELQNVSKDSIDLFMWKIFAGKDSATISRHHIIAPGGFAIICGTTASVLFQPYGLVIGIQGFPSLNNDGEMIQLLSPQKTNIHTVQYGLEWYGSAIKQQGGWSLEMVDTKLPCGDEYNWKASTHPHGGTPGGLNAVNAHISDDKLPSLIRTYTKDSLSIAAVFDESVNSSDAANANNYHLDPSVDILQAEPIPPLFREVVLRLSKPLQRKVAYTLIVENIRDCHGNEIGTFKTASAGLPDTISAFDLVVNEILFNPPAGGSDYIEIFNRSAKVIDLINVYVASRNITGQLIEIHRIHTSPMLLFPGQYFVVSEDREWTSKQYHVKYPSNLFRISGLPVFTDDKGTVVLITNNGVLIDEVSYSEKWHFPLLTNTEGVSLERINYNEASQNSSNWSSASSTSGFGTPTYQNSQWITGSVNDREFKIDPPLFSPDQDGREDLLFMYYKLNGYGYMGTISVFNANGIKVRTIVNNVSLSTEGFYTWDGLDNNNVRLPSGVYIIMMDVFNLSGKRKKFRKAVTLAIGFN